MERGMLRVGLIGYGAIGQEIVRLMAEHAISDIVVVGALVRHPARLRPPGSPPVFTDRSALFAQRPHVVAEVAGHGGLQEHGPAILRAGIDLVLISVGALAQPHVLREFLDAAQMGGAQAKVAAGAIGALDALAAATLGELTQVTHTIHKRPETLLPPEEAALLTTTREIFRGSARQAVLQFPEFLNVAAAVALAGKGFDQTEVRVLADPAVKYSQHEIQAEGSFGHLCFSIENAPVSPPGLTAMSVVRSLLLRRAQLIVG